MHSNREKAGIGIDEEDLTQLLLFSVGAQARLSAVCVVVVGGEGTKVRRSRGEKKMWNKGGQLPHLISLWSDVTFSETPTQYPI